MTLSGGEGSDVEDDVHELMAAAGWSDGLPLVPPTPLRVDRMLRGTARAADEVLGLCPPMYASVSVRRVAINAVMAGCEPRHLRIVLAAVEAMLAHPFNLHGVHATTMGATPAVLVSGPARGEAGLNSAHSALGGSGSRANASIGRAIKLVLQNVGGARLGGTESTTLGSPCKISLCIAEAEEALTAHGWQPYHATSRGYNAGDSVVTVLACTSGPAQCARPPARPPTSAQLDPRCSARLPAWVRCHRARLATAVCYTVMRALTVRLGSSTLRRATLCLSSNCSERTWRAHTRRTCPSSTRRWS